MSDWLETEIGTIPRDWKLIPLNELSSQIVDGTHFTPRYEDNGVPFLRVTDIQSSEIDLKCVKRISEQEHRILNLRCNPEYGDILLSKNGTVGIPKVVNWKWRFSIFVSLCLLKLKPSVESRFLSYVIESSLIAEQIRRRAKQGTVTNLHLEEIRDFLIPCPDKIEQRKIARILTTLDNLIEKTESLIAKYQAVKQGMMHDLFTRGVDAHAKLRPPQAEAPDLYKQSELGWIPKEWADCLLDEVAMRGSGHTPNKMIPAYWNGGIKWVSLADSDKLDQLFITTTDKNISELGLANSSAVRHRPGTVILSRDAGIGKSSIISDVMAVSQHFMAWFCGPRLINYFLYYWLQHEKPRFEAIAMGSTIKTIGLSYFKKLRIAVPPLNEQSAGSNALLAVEQRLVGLAGQLTKFKQVQSGLMQDLLTGKVRVKVDEEESADV